MWTLLEATFCLIFAIFSASSDFSHSFFQKLNSGNQFRINFSNFSINVFKSESGLSEAFSSQTIPSCQPDVDVVFLHFCNMLIIAGKHAALRLCQIVYFRSVLAMNNKWDWKIFWNEKLTKLTNYCFSLSLSLSLSFFLSIAFPKIKFCFMFSHQEFHFVQLSLGIRFCSSKRSFSRFLALCFPF